MRVVKWVIALGVVAVLVLVSSPAGADTAAPSGMSPARAEFTRTWVGHTRLLKVGRDRRAHERVDDGCCDHVVDLTLRLHRFRGNRAHGSVRAVVVRVHVYDPSAFSPSNPAPHKGERGVLRLRHGVLYEPFLQLSYCDPRAETTGACGA